MLRGLGCWSYEALDSVFLHGLVEHLEVASFGSSDLDVSFKLFLLFSGATSLSRGDLALPDLFFEQRLQVEFVDALVLLANLPGLFNYPQVVFLVVLAVDRAH